MNYLNAFCKTSILALALNSGQALGQQCNAEKDAPYKTNLEIPTKTIKIYNNTPVPIYALIETNANKVDEWLQAYFGLCDSSLFSHKTIFRIYVNGLQGIPANGFVSLKVPLYTKLTEDVDPVTGLDRYVNWWNGGRIKIYDSLTTLEEDYNQDNKHRLSPKSEGISCNKDEGSSCNDLAIFSGDVALKDATPSQLTEYTFAGAPLKPNGDGARIWAQQDVDWDVSYVDSAYLPIAMGVMGNHYIGYTGTALSYSDFKAKIANFLSAGSPGYHWSTYLIPGEKESIVKIPGAYNYFRGILEKTLTDALKDSPLNQMSLLWKSCFQEGSPAPKFYDFDYLEGQAEVDCPSPMKEDLWSVHRFFAKNLEQYKNDSQCDSANFFQNLTIPLNSEVLARIYGWVPFNDFCQKESAANSLCKTSNDASDPAISNPNPTLCTKEYHKVHKLYRDLAYSYTGNKYPKDLAHHFNPYVELIHGENYFNMSGYAFSIDDAVGNMQESGTGLILAVGGTKGLENTKPYSPKEAITITMGTPQVGRPTWKSFNACDVKEQCQPQSLIPEGGTGFKLGTIETFPVKVVIKDSADRLYQFIIKEGPNKANDYHIPVDAVKSGSCKVTDAKGKLVHGWCAPFLTKEAHGTPYAHTKKDENNRPVNYISANDPPAL